MNYTFNEVEANRHAAAFLATGAFLMAFFGGYFSSQENWWWMGLAALLISWKTYSFMILESEQSEINIRDMYSQVIAVGVSLILGLIFLLVFWFGYQMGLAGRWWAGLPLILIYALVARFVNKPYP